MRGRVLIIAHCFPPARAIGAQRPCGLAKYLARSGWEPVVLTVRRPGAGPEGIEVVATGYTDRLAAVKRLAGFDSGSGVHQQMGIPVTKHYSYPTWKSKAIRTVREIVAFPDEERGWYRHAVESASRYMEDRGVDAVISTSFPVTSHLIARKLKSRYGVPWIADLRDLWTQNHYYGKSGALRFLERRLEIRTLSSADALVTVSGPLADELGGLHRGKDIWCITNGFDPDDFSGTDPGLTEKFSITYTGRLYNGVRDPSMFFETAAGLIESGDIDRAGMEIVFYGPREEWLMADIKKYGLEDVARVYGPVSRQEAIRKQEGSQLLLLLLWNDKREKGVYTGKLFEYLGSRRPILAIGGANSIVKDLLADTGAGRFAENKGQLAEVLMRYYREFTGSGQIRYRANGALEQYSYLSIARRYSKLLDKVTQAGTKGWKA